MPGSFFSHNSDTQHQSTKVGEVAKQLPLLGERESRPQEISYEIIVSRENLRDVFILGQAVADVSDGDVCKYLNIDKSTWSRIKSGEANVPTDKWDKLNRLFKNLPLMWLAYRAGYELRPFQSELERKIYDLEAELERERRDKEVIVKFLREAGR